MNPISCIKILCGTYTCTDGLVCNHCCGKFSVVARSCIYFCVGFSVLVRNKKRSHSTAVGASMMSNKKVSSLVNKVRGTAMPVHGCMLQPLNVYMLLNWLHVVLNCI